MRGTLQDLSPEATAAVLAAVAVLLLAAAAAHMTRGLRALGRERAAAAAAARSGLCAGCERTARLRADGRMPAHVPAGGRRGERCPGGGQRPARVWPGELDRAGGRPPEPAAVEAWHRAARALASPCATCGASRGALVHRLGHAWTPSAGGAEGSEREDTEP